MVCTNHLWLTIWKSSPSQFSRHLQGPLLFQFKPAATTRLEIESCTVTVYCDREGVYRPWIP